MCLSAYLCASRQLAMVHKWLHNSRSKEVNSSAALMSHNKKLEHYERCVFEALKYMNLEHASTLGDKMYILDQVVTLKRMKQACYWHEESSHDLNEQCYTAEVYHVMCLCKAYMEQERDRLNSVTHKLRLIKTTIFILSIVRLAVYLI